jgi:putative hydrolase of the HAD superfamily
LVIRGEIEAVLFDVGGVLQLIDPNRVQRAIAPLGIDVDNAVIHAAHYSALASLENWTSPRRRSLDPSEYFLAYVEAMGVLPTLQHEAADRVTEALADGNGWTHIVDEALGVLEHLESRGIQIAIVSNTHLGGVEQRLREAGLCQIGEGDAVCVTAILDSHEIGVAKPHPDIFMAALRAVGRDPEKTAFIGDSVIDDVHGSGGVGITPIHFDPHGLCGMDDHLHARSLRQVPALLGLETIAKSNQRE